MSSGRRPRISKKVLEAAGSSYSTLLPRANRLAELILQQVLSILESEDIFLGVPLESRIKSLDSIQDKMRRKSLDSISSIDDLIGIRIILLFEDDVERVHSALKQNFELLEFENTSNRLGDDKFGYHSHHYILKIPHEWAKVPSYGDLSDLKVEVQVRTLAQHIWAAASHRLQYKREASVPPPLRRSIFRLSALLETVDLELSRVLVGRQNYTKTIDPIDHNEYLNADNLARILRETWPIDNLDHNEPFGDLLEELIESKILREEELVDALIVRKPKALSAEASHANSQTWDPDDPEFDRDRFERGVYFTHIGLTRVALDDLIGGPDALKFL